MADPAPSVNRHHIEAYLAKREQRLKLQRQADDLEKEEKKLAQPLLAYVRSHGDDGISCVRSGYVLLIKRTRGSVGWNKEFVRVAGQEEAERLSAAAPPRESLVVEKQ